MKSLILPCAILAIGAGSAHANSDGYFCSSTKFLAYEFSFSKEPGNQHRLYVVHFGEPFSGQPVSIQIPNFQVHRMICSESQVEILGWENRYVFSVSSATLRLASEAKLSAPGSFPKDHQEPHNLAGWSPVARNAGLQEYTFKLGADDALYKYELRIQKLDPKNQCEIAVTTNLVKIDGKGEIRETLPIYKNNKVPQECGE